jgi:hypothetical protein
MDNNCNVLDQFDVVCVTVRLHREIRFPNYYINQSILPEQACSKIVGS